MVKPKSNTVLNATDDDEDSLEVDERTNDKNKFLEASASHQQQTPDTNHLKVFVGGIPFRTDEVTLRSDFEECGEIAEFVYPKDDQGRYKGIAFVTYTTKAAVEKALKYDGDDYGGRVLKVAMATPRTRSKGGKGDGGERNQGGKGKDGKFKGDGKGKGKTKGKGKNKSSGKGDGKAEGKGRVKSFGFELGSDDE